MDSKFPKSELWRRHQAADVAIRELSKRGWIGLFIMRWMPSADADYERIHPNAVPSTLRQPQRWYPDNGAPPFVERVVLRTTEAGRAAWAAAARGGDLVELVQRFPLGQK